MKNLTIICLLLTFIGCNTTKKKTATTTQENVWSMQLDKEYNVVSLNGQNVEENKLTLKLDSQENSIKGFAGCNTYFGEYNLSDTNLKIENVASTRMYCEKSMKVERQFLGALSNAKSYTMADGKIIVKDSNNDQLIILK